MDETDEQKQLAMTKPAGPEAAEPPLDDLARGASKGGTASSHDQINTLVDVLVELGRREEEIIAKLSEAVGRLDKDSVFQLATQLVGLNHGKEAGSCTDQGLDERTGTGR